MKKVYKNICKHCGKEFTVSKDRRNIRYCSDSCKKAAREEYYQKIKQSGQVPKVHKEKVKVVCAECGKEEYVNVSRAKKYICCSLECSAIYQSKIRSTKVDAICEVCGKVVKVKPSRLKRQKHFTCSKECSNILKKTTYLGENNHQFGLRGPKNSSFKDQELFWKNGNLNETLVYKPELERRVTKHRDIVMSNKDKFNEVFFQEGSNILKPGAQVHHKNVNHDDNRLENLVILSRAEHTSLHNSIKSLALKTTSSIIGVLKQYKLLETDLVLDQQSEVTTDSETISIDDPTEVIAKIKEIVSDNIVQLEKLTEESSRKSIEEFSKFANRQQSDEETSNNDSSDKNAI